MDINLRQKKITELSGEAHQHFFMELLEINMLMKDLEVAFMRELILLTSITFNNTDYLINLLEKIRMEINETNLQQLDFPKYIDDEVDPDENYINEPMLIKVGINYTSLKSPLLERNIQSFDTISFYYVPEYSTGGIFEELKGNYECNFNEEESPSFEQYMIEKYTIKDFSTPGDISLPKQFISTIERFIDEVNDINQKSLLAYKKYFDLESQVDQLIVDGNLDMSEWKPLLY